MKLIIGKRNHSVINHYWWGSSSTCSRKFKNVLCRNDKPETLGSQNLQAMTQKIYDSLEIELIQSMSPIVLESVGKKLLNLNFQIIHVEERLFNKNEYWWKLFLVLRSSKLPYLKSQILNTHYLIKNTHCCKLIRISDLFPCHWFRL